MRGEAYGAGLTVMWRSKCFTGCVYFATSVKSRYPLVVRSFFFREPAEDLRVIVLRGGKMTNTRIHIDGFEAGSVKPEKKN
jgi:hypothetical protein